MGTQHSVYINDRELDLWRRAQDHARRHRLAMNALIMTALEAYLEQHDQPEPRRKR
jgi:hypothetical protein